jgi:hypothetical protein
MVSPLELKCAWIDLAALAINKFLVDLRWWPQSSRLRPIEIVEIKRFDMYIRRGKQIRRPVDLRNHRLDCLLYRNHSSCPTNFFHDQFPLCASDAAPHYPYHDTKTRDDERRGVQACLPRIAI